MPDQSHTLFQYIRAVLKYISNDRLIDATQAMVSINDLGLLRGYGIFDFFRLAGHVPLFIEEHLDRFYQSAAYLRLQPPVGREELRDLIFEMIRYNQLRDSGVRTLLTGGESPNGYLPGIPSLFVINEPIKPLPEASFSQGIKLITSEYLRDMPEVKTTNYIRGIYLLPEIEKAGATDVLYHWRGVVSELTRSNFFIISRDGTLITPEKGILKGVTRGKLLEIARSLCRVEEREVHLDEVKAAAEAFITGTTKKVTPVVQIDDWPVNGGQAGPLTRKLQHALDMLIERYCAEHPA
jgi:branched-chain amino acid aminotransferase